MFVLLVVWLAPLFSSSQGRTVKGKNRIFEKWMILFGTFGIQRPLFSWQNVTHGAQKEPPTVFRLHRVRIDPAQPGGVCDNIVVTTCFESKSRFEKTHACRVVWCVCVEVRMRCSVFHRCDRVASEGALLSHPPPSPVLSRALTHESPQGWQDGLEFAAAVSSYLCTYMAG